MATTTLYFHAATSTVGGTLPSASQSGLTFTGSGGDAQTVNRSMSPVIGTSQTSIAKTSAASTSASSYYFTKFISPPLEAQTIAGATWTFQFAAEENNAAANFPVAAASSALPNVCCYVWRPSTGAVVNNILLGASTATYKEAGTTETAITGTFAGSSVVALAGDVIVMEIVFTTTQGGATARTDTFFYDGTTAASTSSNAAFLSNPNTINFFYSYAIAEPALSVSEVAARRFTRTISESVGSISDCLAVIHFVQMSESVAVVKIPGATAIFLPYTQTIFVVE
jgi:hypothetical protein